jgi:hypothetical protein
MTPNMTNRGCRGTVAEAFISTRKPYIIISKEELLVSNKFIHHIKPCGQTLSDVNILLGEVLSFGL